MLVCVPCEEPGGEDGRLAASFETADVFDYWEVDREDGLRHVAQNRTCHGSFCVEPVEAVHRRRTEVVIVASMSSPTLARFASLGIEVMRSEDQYARDALHRLVEGRLEHLDNRRKGV